MIVLTGFMGAGKTTLGKRLSNHFALPFLDADQQLTERYEQPAGDLLTAWGETRFRATESALVCETLTDSTYPPHQPYSLSGGAITAAQVRAALTEHFVVYLHITEDQIRQTPHLAETRPLLQIDTWQDRYAERLPLYGDVADLTISAYSAPPAKLLQEVLLALPEQLG